MAVPIAFTVEPISTLTLPMLDPLRTESRAAGFRFLDRLWADYDRGVNRFDRPGEALFGAFCRAELVGIGGLNVDPFAGDREIGRVRRVYVRASDRRSGVGRTLMAAIVGAANGHFRRLTLRTNTSEGAAFYEALGFRADTSNSESTHLLDLAGEERPSNET